MSVTKLATRKLRLLCLHGYRTNAQVMMDQTRGLQHALGDNTEFIFLNAPYIAKGPTDETIQRLYGKDTTFYEWAQWRELKRGNVEDAKSDTQTKSIECKDNEWNYEYNGLDQTIEYMDEQLHKLGPFDAIIGFSQGGIMATVLSMWYLQHHNTKWWKLCVLFSAPRVRAVNVRPLFEHGDGARKRVPFPSIHVFGKKDEMHKSCVEMVDMYDDESMGIQRFVFEHDSGHKFPSADRHVELYEDLAKFIVAHCKN